MKTKIVPAKRMTLEAFAEEHDLTMELIERTEADLVPSMTMERARWQARFVGAEVKRGALLAGEFGQGGTQEIAMLDYARKIMGQTLVFDAHNPDRARREIRVPMLDMPEIV